MMANRNGINADSLSQFVDRNLRLAEQGLKNPVFRAFHGREYTRLPEYCQYTREIS